MKFVWSDRAEGSKPIAGVGVAASVEVASGDAPTKAIDQCRELIGDSKLLRFFGGQSFSGEDNHDRGWQSFGAGRYVAPRFLLEDGHLHVTVMSEEDRVNAEIDCHRVNFEQLPPSSDALLPKPSSKNYAPTRDGWLSITDEALTLIRSEVLEKIVLARKTTLEFEQLLDAWQITERIADATYDCYVFCFQFGEGQAFLGSTPERLFHRSGENLESEVVAGDSATWNDQWRRSATRL